MRKQLERLQKGRSTKAERRFSELLKELHIPFRAKVEIQGREVDFLIGNYAIEIDGHDQNVRKNMRIRAAGYLPLHLNNWEIHLPSLRKWLIQTKK